MSPRRFSVGLAACVATVSAGCSSSGATPPPSPPSSHSPIPLSAAAYRDALHQVALEEDTAQQKVQQAFHAHAVAQINAALTGFGADQRLASQRVAAITPPANAVIANTQLSRAFDDNASSIDSLLATLSGATTVKQALGLIQHDHKARRAGREIDAALARLKRLGYTTGS